MGQKILSALDIGTGKIFGICGVCQGENIEVVAADSRPLAEDIVKKGRIVDIEAVSDIVFEVLTELGEQAGERLEWLTTSVGGGHLKGEVFSKSMDIEPSGRAITETDIIILEKEIKSSVANDNFSSRKLLHSLAQEYVVDSLNTTKRAPVGMHGNTLEMRVHIVTVDTNPFHDLVNVIKEAGVHVASIYPHSWAAAEAVLTQEEKKLGCTLIDMGRGTTDIVFLSNNITHLTNSFKFGGDNIDKDISYVLHTPIAYSEELKQKYGRCDLQSLKRDNNRILAEQVEVFNPAGKPGRMASVEKISSIVCERAKEILIDQIKRSVAKNSLLYTSGGGIIISGGCARLKGIVELCEEVFDLPARVGYPKNLLNLDKSFQNPEYSVGVGLLMLASKLESEEEKSTLWGKVRKLLDKWV